jgi:23S rRNA pseudouridine955/2504/2580 synthase
MQKFTVGKNEANQRLDKFLVKYLPEAPKSLIYKMLRKKNITLNGKKSEGSEIISIGDTIESFFSDETFVKLSGSGLAGAAGSNENSSPNVSSGKKTELNKLNPVIVYEDDDIVIVDKPAGMLSQKAVNTDYSVNEWLIDHLLETGSLTKENLKTFKPSICNRLDRNTSGLLICGKSLSGLQTMSEIIRTGHIEKYYVTLAHGKMDKPFKARGILQKDSKQNKSFIKNLSKDDLEANIETDFKPLKVYENATLLEVNLHTGKPHQIRAQLAALGHPIFGDKKYGAEDKGLKYQILQAYRLVFPDIEYLSNGFERLAGKEIVIPYSKLLNDRLNKLENGNSGKSNTSGKQHK